MNYKAITILILLAILMTALSAQQKAPALDKHGKLGVNCNDCHGTTARTTTLSNDKCLTCHGGSYAALVKASSKNYAIKQGITNPHASHTARFAAPVATKTMRHPLCIAMIAIRHSSTFKHHSFSTYSPGG